MKKVKLLSMLATAAAAVFFLGACAGPEVHNVSITEDAPKRTYKPKPKPADNPRDFKPVEGF
ncbi:hypothetical protein [Haloferula sp. A504]|uniref:hypothetical protein n=1 Tax=Haloferula sp. A504 TaxID=3373601 RepID=UPI0031BECE7A|nr:hypothetical protein [Verrucomicrobiaceae bacterium E54]